MPILMVRRERTWADKLRQYRILVDGVEIGRLSQDGELRHKLAEGRHLMEARIDWCGSGPHEFEVHAADKVAIVRNALSGWRIFLITWHVIFKRNGYLTVEIKDA